MKKFLYKLLFGKPEYNIRLDHTSYRNQWKNLKEVWNNEKHNDIGLEKCLRLFLVGIQFAFPGLLIRDIFGRKGFTWKNLGTEGYVILKTILPLFLLFSGLYKSKLAVIIICILLFETICYIATLIFVSDAFMTPRSYRRSVLLLLFNYLEIAFDFAVIYGGLHLLNDKAHSIIDFIYFSFITSATIGYGDLYPINDTGKILVGLQSVLFLIFVVLFINFFGSRIEAQSHSNKKEREN